MFESVGHASSCEAERVFCGMLELAVSEVTEPGVIVSLLILCRAISENVIHQGLLLLWPYSPCYYCGLLLGRLGEGWAVGRLGWGKAGGRPMMGGSLGKAVLGVEAASPHIYNQAPQQLQG